MDGGSSKSALRSVTFTLRSLTPTINELRKMHFGEYKRVREALAWTVRAALNDNGYFAQYPMKRALVTIERHSVGLPDEDNATGGVKPLVDCLVQPSASHPNGLGVIFDDNPICLMLMVKCVRVTTYAEQRTVVTIEEQEQLPSTKMPKRRMGRNGGLQADRTKARAARASAIYNSYLPQ